MLANEKSVKICYVIRIERYFYRCFEIGRQTNKNRSKNAEFFLEKNRIPCDVKCPNNKKQGKINVTFISNLHSFFHDKDEKGMRE